MFYAFYPPKTGVTSINGLTGALTLVGIGGIAVESAGTTITIDGTGLSTLYADVHLDNLVAPTAITVDLNLPNNQVFASNVQTGSIGPVDGTANLYFSDTYVQSAVDFFPLTTNTQSLGNTGNQWNNLFVLNATISYITGLASIVSGGDLDLNPGSGQVAIGFGTNGLQNGVQFYDTTGNSFVGFQSPSTVTTSVEWTLPPADGTTNQALTTNGAGTLSWESFILTSQEGVANGVATLDGSGKIPLTQLPAAVFIYQGTWNPNTNTPALVDGTGVTGYVYWVSAAKLTPVSGLNNPSMTNFQIGDLVIYNGTQWELTTPAAGVSSVNGMQGAVTVNAINQLTGDGTAGPASGSQSEAFTLATVNSNVGTFTNATITVNAKGLITAASSGTSNPGTVTSVSVVSANGLAGTVANPTSTPAITLSTTVTGILQGNGTAISAAPTTGTGNVVLSASPTLTGTAIATSLTMSGNLIVNANATFASSIYINGSTSGQIQILSQANSGTYTFDLPTTPGTTGQLLTSDGGAGTGMTWTTAGTGTVSSVSVVSANGLAGTVATATTTPAITLSTTITGLLKGNGTAISAAVAGTDYVIPSGSITGTASNVTGTVVVANGGTGDTSFTANQVILGGTTTTGALQQVSGGTGGQVLQAAGPTSAPFFATIPGNSTILKATTRQIFTSGTSATYTTPTSPSPLYLKVTVVGGGGAGGGTSSSVGAAGAGGGGGGGGSTIAWIASPASTYTYTVGAAGTPGIAGNVAGGAGGASTFSTLTANGGSGGGGSGTSTTPIVSTTSTAGGTASGGNVNVSGGAGGCGTIFSAASALPGGGGSSLYSNFVPGNTGSGAGVPGNGYGGGGAGAVQGNNGGAFAGGAGSSGIIIVEEYYQ